VITGFQVTIENVGDVFVGTQCNTCIRIHYSVIKVLSKAKNAPKLFAAGTRILQTPLRELMTIPQTS